MFLKYVLRNSPEVGSYSYVSSTMNIIAFLMIVRIQNSIPQVKVTSSTIYIITSFLCSILKIKVWIKGTTFPGNIYIVLVPSRAIYILPWLQGNIRNIALHWPLICPRKVVYYVIIVLCMHFNWFFSAKTYFKVCIEAQNNSVTIFSICQSLLLSTIVLNDIANNL